MRGTSRAGGETDVFTLRERFLGKAAEGDGFTIAELLFAVAILLIVLMGVLGAVGFAAGATRQAATREGAIQLANQKIEYARNIPYEALGTKNPDGSYGDPPGVLPATESVTTTTGVYTVKNEVWFQRNSDPDPQNRTVMYKKIKVTVSWTSPNPASVGVESAIYGVDTNAVVGDVSIFCQDNDTLAGVSGVSVTLDPAGSASNRTVTSDNSGYSIYGQVPYGHINGMTASKAGYMVDTTRFASECGTVSPNIVNAWTLHLQRPKSAVIHLQGTNGQALQGVSVSLKDVVRNITYTSMLTNSSGDTPAFSNLWNSTNYLVTATMAGKDDTSTTFAIGTMDTNVTKTLKMNDPAQLTVTVRDKNSNALVSGAAVTITGPATVAGSGNVTASDGTISFSITKSGLYHVTVSKAGYIDYAYDDYVDLSAGTQSLNVQLQPMIVLQIAVTDAYTGTAPSTNTNITVKDSAGNTDFSGVTSGGTISFNVTTTDNYTIYATNSNYQNYTGTAFSINMSGASPVAKTVSLITGRITVHVQKSTGVVPTPTSTGLSVALYLSGNSTAIMTQTTDSSGNTTFGPLATGTYYVIVTNHDGSKSSKLPVTAPTSTYLPVLAGVSTPYNILHNTAN